jgi:hypothetical protein
MSTITCPYIDVDILVAGSFETKRDELDKNTISILLTPTEVELLSTYLIRSSCYLGFIDVT